MTLLDAPAAAPAPRRAQGRRYPLPPLLAAVATAMLSGHRGHRPIGRCPRADADDLRVHLDSGRDALPAFVTARAVLQALDSEALADALRAWAAERLPDDGVLAVDAKAVRSTVSDHDPTASDEPTATWEAPIAVEVEVRDRLVVVEVVPRVTQSIPLRVGWNLVSTWVAPSDSTTRSVLGDAAPNVLLVKDQNGRVFAPTYEIDDVPFWVKTRAYDVYATAPDTLSVEGRPVPGTTPIPLEAGWNHVAFLGRAPLPIAEALASISDHVVLVRDGHGNEYAPAKGLRSLTTLDPGEGYQINVSAPVVLRYPTSGGPADAGAD